MLPGVILVAGLVSAVFGKMSPSDYQIINPATPHG